MRILFVADARSPIALNWMEYFNRQGHEVHVISMYPAAQNERWASLTVIPAAFTQAVGGTGRKNWLVQSIPTGLRTRMRQWLTPSRLPRAANAVRRKIEEVQPEIVHGMRIPYEGMLAALALEKMPNFPLLISVWGNDFTLHAPSTVPMGELTRKTLKRSDAVHTDCQRDLRMAAGWGFGAGKPKIVLPGAGGVKRETFYPTESNPGEVNIINPRGLRAYARTDTFFRALPAVLEAHPEVKILCPAMAGEAEAEEWVRRLGLENAVQLLPRLSRMEMGEAFRRSTVALSITTHDGTPNTLLEAMACGCYPIAGDLESLREWINSGENGTLVNPDDPAELAEAIHNALEEEGLRQKAREINLRLVAERADYELVMPRAEAFYREIIQWKGASTAKT